MRTILFAASVACFLSSSCGSNSSAEVYVAKDSTGKPITVNTDIPEREPQKKVQPAAIQQMPQPQQQMTAAQQQQQQQQDIQRQIQQQIQQQQMAQNAVATAKGMNPPHGQPGHRCDIPVGAPLNSKPVANPTTATQPQAVVTTTQQPVALTAPGMNPPHGQPNHRCDIAVGAPLNSKPAITTPVTTTPVITTPAKKDSGQ